MARSIKLGYPQYPFVILDGRTYKFIRKINLPEESTWSNIDPNKLYGELSGTNQFVSADATTGAFTVLHTFTEYDHISLGNYEGNISNDDHYAALLATKGSTNFIVVYDILNDNVVATHTIGSAGLDWVSMSQSGNYVVVNWGSAGASPGQGIDVYDRNLNFLHHLRDDTPHGDLGYDTEGNEVFVGLGYVFGATISAFRLDGGGIITLLDANPGFWGGHISCRNTKRLGWCYVSDDGWSPDLWLGHDEVFAIKVDSSHTVERFAHEHHSYNAGYDHEPMAVPNRDGTKVMWASDWGGGSTAPVYSYVAETPIPAIP